MIIDGKKKISKFILKRYYTYRINMDSFWSSCYGDMKAPDLEFFRKVKQGFAELYKKYKLEPAGASGINVCLERDI